LIEIYSALDPALGVGVAECEAMRAVVQDRYGPPEVLRVADVERPAPKDDEVLIRVHATTVIRTDCGLRSADPFVTRFVTGLRRPKRTLGVELAGEVEADAMDRQQASGVRDHPLLEEGRALPQGVD
jgi:NADPH:quinone reductase-like Zn-dependent oxidoreductase